jgi:hypothetical protein
MLRLLGVWKLPRSVWMYLTLSVVLLAIGFLLDLLAAVLGSRLLEGVAVSVLVVGIACGLIAAFRAARPPSL